MAGLVAIEGAGAQVRHLKPPEPMPSFSLKDLDGETHALEDYRGNPLVLSLWATWCMPCRYELPEFDRARREIARTSPKVTFMTVNIGEDAGRARAWLEKNNLSLPVLFATESFGDELGVTSIPTILVIDPRGRVTLIHEGWSQGIDLTTELQKELASLASGGS